MKYRCHDIRRGHALDLQASDKICARANPCIYMQVSRWHVFASGATLYEILAAGEWKSAAFLDYMGKAKLESDLLDQAHLGDCLDSDDDE